MTSALLLALAPLAAAQDAPGEEAYYAVDYLTPPDGEILEVGGMDFLPDGRLVVSTRRGQVWLVDNPLAEDPADAEFSLYVEGLCEGLGLRVVDGDIVVVQRGELSRLKDTDGDGVIDHIETICDGWGLSGNYHEFAYGLPIDAAGNYYVSLNVSFFSPKWWHGKSPVPWRGWVVKIAPDGTLTPFACGLRSPCGLGMNAAGELFATDNQGDWMPVSPIFHVEQDEFYGHPASLDWTDEYQRSQALASDTIPPARAARDRKNAAVWLPYKWSRSPGNVVFDETNGQFGPFGGQMFVAELTNGMVLRAGLEKVKGQYQGWVVPFRQKIGSACRVLFAPDGTLLTGFTNRGWGGLPPASGLARIRWTGATPLEIQRVHLLQDGFELDFTRPLSDRELGPADVRLTQYDYDYWWEYGSPERATTTIEVTGVDVSADRKRLTVSTAGLTAGMMARLVLFDVSAADGTPLMHDEVAYTLNQLPAGPPTNDHVAKTVPPPPARESGEEGWLRLTFGDATDGWSFEGWELVDAALDERDMTKLQTQKGVGALTNTASDAPTNYVSKQMLGDATIGVEFMLPEEGRSGVLVMGRYELSLSDSVEERELTPAHCGAIAPGETTPGRAPALHAYGGPGRWHKLEIEFQAPRFDAANEKIENARFLKVQMDGTLLHYNVELSEPTRGALGPEVPYGPLVLRGDRTHVAFGNIRVKPRPVPAPSEETGWVRLFDGESIDGWKISDEGAWSVEDGAILGEGPRSHLFSPRDDYADVEIRAKIKINDGGNSGLYFRTAYGPAWPAGYEAQINSSFADPQKTGSLYGLAPVKTHLVSPDTWFDYHVTCRDEEGGTRVVIRVNGVVVSDHLDTERKHERGHIALQQHHDGSVVEVQELWVREL